jgi:serine/threonine protein kinase
VYSSGKLLQLSATNEDAEVVAKVADFGLSSLLFVSTFREKSSNMRKVENPAWLAPEVTSSEEYSEKVVFLYWEAAEYGMEI